MEPSEARRRMNIWKSAIPRLAFLRTHESIPRFGNEEFQGTGFGFIRGRVFRVTSGRLPTQCWRPLVTAFDQSVGFRDRR